MAGALGAARQRLSSLLTTTQKHAKPVLDATEREVTQRYSRMMEANKQYVVKDQAKAETLLKQWWYTKLARIPDNITHAQREVGELKGTLSKGKELHLNEVGTLALFAGEVYAWFVVGEIVGRGFTLVDYDV